MRLLDAGNRRRPDTSSNQGFLVKYSPQPRPPGRDIIIRRRVREEASRMAAERPDLRPSRPARAGHDRRPLDPALARALCWGKR